MWWRINAWGEIACIIASMLMAPLLLTFVDSEAARLLMMAGVATAAGVVTSLVVGPEDLEQLDRFYRRARPPGFWGPIACRVGDTEYDGPARLRRAVLALAGCAVTVFGLLAAGATLLAQSPPPRWLPWTASWLGLLSIASLAAIPLWWPTVFGKRASRG